MSVDETGRRDAYVPRMTPAYWDVMQDFVLETTAMVASSLTYPEDVTRRAITALALWAWVHAGLPLDRVVLFRKDVIANYVATGCGQMSMSARGNRRSLLFRISEQLDKSQASHFPPLPPSDPTAPYTQTEIVAMLSWARSQTTADRRRNAHVLIGLGLGAGASAQEIIELTSDAVIHSDDRVDVHLPGPRAREVPVVSDWAPLLPRATGPPSGFYFRPGRRLAYANAISNFVARGPTGVRPQSQRLRTTWIVRHLDAGTPPKPLIEAAGVESLEAFTRYMRFTRSLNPQLRDEYLRNPTVH